ncbi:hypothetical protein QYM36_011471 [Artemia franciscana]|uniref:Uncharacterized protein n=1 Tax=Artemia franciscana TaxID=6661 RepID=A0AA88HM37_ARTSF|nr:hypothetical protein QYM36_011471 [Artemia franciscana]
MEFEGAITLKEIKCDTPDLCKETVDTTGAQNVIQQDTNTVREVTNKHNSVNINEQCNDVSQSTAKDGKNTEETKRRTRRRKRTNKPCRVDFITDKVLDKTSRSIIIDGEKVEGRKKSKCNNKEKNATSAEGTITDGQEVEGRKTPKCNNQKKNVTSAEGSITDGQEVEGRTKPKCNNKKKNATSAEGTITDGQEVEGRKKTKCNNKKKNATSAEGTDRLEKSEQKNIVNQKIADENQQGQKDIVKTFPRKDLEGFLQRKFNYSEDTSDLYRVRRSTNTDNHGRQYTITQGINRGRGKTFTPNRNGGSTYDRDRGKGGSNFKGGREIFNTNLGRGKFDFNKGRGIFDFNKFGSSDREIFNNGSGRPYFKKGSDYEINGCSAFYAQNNIEFKNDSYGSKGTNFTDRGRGNEEFNRRRTSGYGRNAGSENEGEKWINSRGRSHTADVEKFLVRDRETRGFSRGRDRRNFQRERRSSYNKTSFNTIRDDKLPPTKRDLAYSDMVISLHGKEEIWRHNGSTWYKLEKTSFNN